MKKITKRVLSLLLAVMTVASMIPIMAVSSSAADGAGMTFSQDRRHETAKAITGEILTFEAEVAIPTTYSKRPGIVVGNYGHETSQKLKFTFEIRDSGSSYYPKLFGYGFEFTHETDLEGNKDTSKPIDVRREAGTFAHIAVTIDKAEGYAHCYIDGVRKATIKLTEAQKADGFFNIDTNVIVGSDYRGPHAGNHNLNDQYFKGAIKNVTLYKDARSAEEIAASAQAADYATYIANNTDTNRIVAYNLDAGVTDISGNSNDLVVDFLTGRKFAADEQLIVNRDFETEIHTFSATVYAPKNVKRTGVIFGNYYGKVNNKEAESMNFEITNDGVPRLRITGADGKTKDVTFEVDVRVGDWINITFVHTSDSVSLYLNGALYETKSIEFEYLPTAMTKNDFRIGGDARSGNSQNFKGVIKDLALYAEPLSAYEVRKMYK